MDSDKTIKEKLEKLRKRRVKSFFKRTIIISLLATLMAVGFTWLELRNVFVFLFLAFLPGMTAILWDKKPGRFASKTVCALNLTGMMPYILSIMNSGSPDVVAINNLSDPYAWLLIYGFAGFGWGIIYLVPQITLIFLEAKSKFMIKRMEKFQEELVSEWGEEVKR